MSDAPIYLDHNATTPLDPRVAAAMAECYQRWPANPASQHAPGRAARRVLEEARDTVAELLGVRLDTRPADQVVFTSGGTEANNLAIRGLVAGTPLKTPPGEIIVSDLEHPSVLGPADALAAHGLIVRRVEVDPRGTINLDHLAAAINEHTRLVCLMLASNETGAIQPVAAAAALCQARGAPLHTDAVQVAGKLPIDFHALGAATMSVSAHKLHGPRGVGALLVRGGVQLAPQLFGGFQQAALRPGSESVALPVGFATALRLWHDEARERQERMTGLRDRFEAALRNGWPDLVIHAEQAARLPHTSHVGFAGLDRQALLMALDQVGIACSAGSACASGSSEPSPTLLAMGVPEALAGGSLRLSFGATTTAAEVDESARRILNICNDLQRQSIPRKSPLMAPRTGGKPV
ncbi:MAG: cysteine desulfurase [Planctomycetia bacterium]|nr:cysteine desulfurase [Planctomycetia bacterium]